VQALSSDANCTIAVTASVVFPSSLSDRALLCCFANAQVRWSDGYPTSWEPEEHVPQDLITAFQRDHPHLFEPEASGEGSGEGERRLADEGVMGGQARRVVEEREREAVA